MEPLELLENYPALADLEKLAQNRMPRFAWEYLDSGTGDDRAMKRNRDALDLTSISPRVMRPLGHVDASCELFGQKYDLPFGIAPIGMSGMLWPRSEEILAAAAVSANIPYCLSTVACETPENIGAIAGRNAWFQLYSFRNDSLNMDLVSRAQESGFSTLMITLDVPWPSMRERQRRAGLRVPPKITPGFVADVVSHPYWAVSTFRRGKPAFRTLEKYLEGNEMQNVGQFVTREGMGGNLVWADIQRFREIWNGPIVLKGIMAAEDAELAVKAGVDAIVVSNHGGRQFDGAPAAIEALPQIVKKVKGRIGILFDGGVRSGLDIIRALALGADFVFLGRPFMHAVAALGEKGAGHAVYILKTDIETNMRQLGVPDTASIRQLDIWQP